MFGADESVCVDGVADPCELTAEAAAWARMVNQARSTGHCEGLVALAAARFNAREDVKTVKVPDQAQTIHTVMRTFATQFVPEVQQVIQRWTKASLAEKVDELKASFADGRANYTLGVYVEGGGHAVLPYAVEYPTPDMPRIMIYDSNWPAKNRFIDVDLANDSWRFSFAGADPANDPDAWTGGPGDMDLTPFDARQGTCPFCGNDVKVAGTTLLLRTADLDWSVSTPDGVVSPSQNSTDGAVVAKPVKGGARDSYDYLIQIPPSSDKSTTTTASSSGSTQLVFGGSASVFAIMPTGIASFSTPGGSGQPVEVGNGSVSSMDPAVSMSLASGNLVAAASGASSELVVSGETMAVTVTAENGQVITQEVTPETPAVQIRADEGSGGLTVLAQAATGEVAKTEVSADGTQTKSVVAAGTLNLSEDLNKVEVVLPKELESKSLAVLPSLEERNLANPNYKADAVYVAPTTIPSKIEEASATTVSVRNAALPTTTERGDTATTVQTRNAALPTTTAPRSVTAANSDSPAAAVLKPTLSNFRVAAKTFGDDAFTLDPPDSNSAGGFRYSSSNASVATVSATTGRVTITGAGSTAITATQSAAKGFEAGTITTTLTVGKAKAVLSALKDTSKVFGDDPFAVREPTSTSPAEITWTSSNETVAKFSKTTGRLVIVGAGKTTITASQASSDDFLAGSESFVLTVGKATPVLSALADVAKTFGDATFTVPKPTSDSRGAMTFASSDSKVATIDATSGVVTIVGAGSVSITATQAATDDYVSTSKTFKLTVGKAKALWGEFKMTDKTYGDAGFKVALPSSTGDGARTFSSSDEKVATIDASSGDVKIVGAGSTTVTVTQAATTNFEASSVAATLTIGKAAPDLTGVSLLDLVFGGKDEKIEPKSTSPGAFTFSSSDSKVLSVDSSGNVKVVGVGTATITVKQGSTANYEAASASVTVKVGKGSPAFERLSPISKEFGDASFTFAPTGSPSSGVMSYSSSNAAVATVNTSTGVVTITGVGVTSLSATQAATDNYGSASTDVLLTVGRGTPTLGSFVLPAKNFGDAAFSVTAPASTSTGAFSYASSNPSVATINSSTGLVTLVGVGTSTITATQAATIRHTSATITSTLTVLNQTPTIGKLSLPTLGHRTPQFTIASPTSNSSAPFTYSSSSPAVATIDPTTGVVTVLSAGTSTITATQGAAGNFGAGSTSSVLNVSESPCLIGSPAAMNTYQVTNMSDSGAGSLRDAITSANASTTLNTIVFACGLSGKIVLASALPNVTDSVSIVGNDRVTTVIDGNALYRPFNVTAGKTLTISSLTLQRGQNVNGGLIYNSQGVVNATDVRFTSMTGGSAVFNNNGTTVASYTNSTFDYLASGINGDYGSTPAITPGYTSWNDVPDTVFTNRTYVTNCVFDRNTYGINNYRYTRIDNSIFTNNSNTGARVTGINRTRISNSEFKSNGTAIYVGGSPPMSWDMGTDQRLVESNRFSANGTAISLNDTKWNTPGDNSYRQYQAWSKVVNNQWDGRGTWVRYQLWTGAANATFNVAGTSSTTSDFVHTGNFTVAP